MGKSKSLEGSIGAVIRKLRSWKRRFWCARYHGLVKDRICISEVGASVWVPVDPDEALDNWLSDGWLEQDFEAKGFLYRGKIEPGASFEVWSMKCGKCE